MSFGDGLRGYFVLIAQHNMEATAMTINMPNQPKDGLKNSVMTAMTGAAAAWPVMTRP